MEGFYFDIDYIQSPKVLDGPCGDVISYYRKEKETVIIFADGLGSGIKANINANFCVSRIKQLLLDGVSPQKTFFNVVQTMEKTKKTTNTYAAFMIIKVRVDGVLTVLNYEMPDILFITTNHLEKLTGKAIIPTVPTAKETIINLKDSEGIIAVCDGIVEAGLGELYLKGWGIDGLEAYASHCYAMGYRKHKLISEIHKKALDISGSNYRDDCSVLKLCCRKSNVLNILTGPPRNKLNDYSIMSLFSELDGTKIISGGKTAEIYATKLNLEISYERLVKDELSPPLSNIDGIDLVTEGAITLNQVYRLCDDDSFYDPTSAIGRMCEQLREADLIRIYLGVSNDLSKNNVTFKQQGLLPRENIIKLLANKLTEMGKIVVIKDV